MCSLLRLWRFGFWCWGYCCWYGCSCCYWWILSKFSQFHETGRKSVSILNDWLKQQFSQRIFGWRWLKVNGGCKASSSSQHFKRIVLSLMKIEAMWFKDDRWSSQGQWQGILPILPSVDVAYDAVLKNIAKVSSVFSKNSGHKKISGFKGNWVIFVKASGCSWTGTK